MYVCVCVVRKNVHLSHTTHSTHTKTSLIIPHHHTHNKSPFIHTLNYSNMKWSYICVCVVCVCVCCVCVCVCVVCVCMCIVCVCVCLPRSLRFIQQLHQPRYNNPIMPCHSCCDTPLIIHNSIAQNNTQFREFEPDNSRNSPLQKKSSFIHNV